MYVPLRKTEGDLPRSLSRGVGAEGQSEQMQSGPTWLFWEGCPRRSQVCPVVLATACGLSGEVGGMGKALTCLLAPAC